MEIKVCKYVYKQLLAKIFDKVGAHVVLILDVSLNILLQWAYFASWAFYRGLFALFIGVTAFYVVHYKL